MSLEIYTPGKGQKKGDHDGGKGKQRSAAHNGQHLETSDLIAERTGAT